MAHGCSYQIRYIIMARAAYSRGDPTWDKSVSRAQDTGEASGTMVCRLWSEMLSILALGGCLFARAASWSGLQCLAPLRPAGHILSPGGLGNVELTEASRSRGDHRVPSGCL
eukprot:4690701-Amphidinium_carterae.1